MEADRRVPLRGGGLLVEVGTRGARLLRVRRDRADGRDVEAVVAAHDEQDDDALPFAGATIGRWANRVADARFELDGRVIDLEPNEGTTSLHGGPDGFHTRVWNIADEQAALVTMRLTSPDGDQGFPGEVRAAVTYELDTDGRLHVRHRATTDAPTVVNLSNHTYWNLADDTTVLDHALTLNADRVMLVDERGIPTEIDDVAGTRFDLREPTPLREVAEQGGFDHCFLLDGRPAARLVHPTTGRQLTLDTDQPGLQVFTGDGLPRPWPGICLEPQLPPDAPNQPHAGDGVLRPGEIYCHDMTITLDLPPARTARG